MPGQKVRGSSRRHRLTAPNIPKALCVKPAGPGIKQNLAPVLEEPEPRSRGDPAQSHLGASAGRHARVTEEATSRLEGWWACGAQAENQGGPGPRIGVVSGWGVHLVIHPGPVLQLRCGQRGWDVHSLRADLQPASPAPTGQRQEKESDGQFVGTTGPLEEVGGVRDGAVAKVPESPAKSSWGASFHPYTVDRMTPGGGRGNAHAGKSCPRPCRPG